MEVAKLFASLGLEVHKGSFEAGEKAIEHVKHALEALAVVEGVKSLWEMIEHVSETADKAVKSAEKLGTTAETIQELGYAANIADVPMGRLQSSLTKLEVRLDQVAQKGKGPAADALRRLGVSASELNKLPIDQKLERIADGFAKLKEGVPKAPLARQLGLGPDMIPLLEKGGAGIRSMREEARALGLVIDNEVAKQFEEWNDDMRRVQGAVQGLKNDAVVALLPVLRELTTSLFEWIKANRELIKQRLEQIMRAVVLVAKSLAAAVAKLYEWFEKIAPIIGDVAAAFADLLGQGESVGDGLTDAAIAVAIAWGLAELPLIALAAGIAAIILIVQDLWSGMQGGDSVTKELLDSFEEYLGETGAGRVVLGLKAAFVALFDFLEGKFKWLMNMGERIGGGIFKFIHGDTEQQVNLGPAWIQAIARKYGLTGIDKVITANDDTRTPDIDSTVRAHGTGLSGIDSIVQASPTSVVSTGLPLWQAGLPGAGFSGYASPQTLAPQMSVQIHVQGGADDKATEEMIHKLTAWWGDTMRETVVETSARGGKLP